VRRNLWSDHAGALAEAYARSAGTIGFASVTRFLLGHLPATPQRIVDVGGGFGRQAIMLARAGHAVVIVDFDPTMLSLARDELAREPADVRGRVELVLGDGTFAAELVGTGFDLACCHSVLMYEVDAAPMLQSVVGLVHVGGLVSVLCVNRDAIAMRAGLQGRWRDAAVTLRTGGQRDTHALPSRAHTREEITGILTAAGARPTAWQGVGVFTDHRTDPIVVEDPNDVYEVEWLASTRDPYRQVARCFHVVAERIAAVR
jgi:SAM-dependent methyltransferase